MIELTDEWKTALNNARDENKTPMWASVDADGQPSLSYYGSTHAHSDGELSLWMRSTARGFLSRIEANPKVAMFYDSQDESRLRILIHGEARRIDDPALAAQIYDQSPEVERTADPNREGVAVLVEITRVIQRGEVVQSRDDEAGQKVD